MAAAICMLDEQHPQLPQPETDYNSYMFGRIGNHNVVIACLPCGVMGITSAARVAAGMRSTFRELRFGLLVGIGGGAPSEEHDIRLGDVVVSRPEGAFGGVIQYDYGKTIQDGRFVQTGSLNRPPDILLSAMAKMQTKYQLEGSGMVEKIEASFVRYPRRKTVSQYPGHDLDQLFHWEYDHPRSYDWASGLLPENSSCDGCDKRYLIHRHFPRLHEPDVHYGLIASGNQVVRDGKTRERLRKEKRILCFEMEAAGIVDEFPCLVVRGICDYADSHKNKRWQNYAATTAAAYASELLSVVPASRTYTEKGFKPFAGSIQHRVFAGGNERDHRHYRDDQDGTIAQSLAFDGMFSRRNNVERQHPRTCTWIIENKRFIEWIGQSNGLLWLKGIPGAGKSTLMSFLYDYFQSHIDPSMIRLDFFFNARGTALQKQFLGLLRSMVYQIFKQDESIRPKIRRLFLEKMSEVHNQVDHLVWQQHELESLFYQVLEISAQSNNVFVFVDALDEAGPAFARHIALYLHRLNECVVSQAGNAKFCISSRHYPMVITIPGTEIAVEEYNRADIERFILENLPLNYLLGAQPNDWHMWQKLQRDLVLKASGSFQWARLVVPLVEKQITDGKSVVQIYKSLQNVPEALHEAYSHVLKNVISIDDWSQSLLLFQWVCLACRPLSVVELRYAMAASDLHPNSERAQPSQSKLVVNNQDQMVRQVRALSGGLLRTVGSGDELKVEPIHQSVNDFLMAGGLDLLTTAGSNSTGAHDFSMIDRSHCMMFQACLRYMQIGGVDVVLQDAKKLKEVELQLNTIRERHLAQQSELRNYPGTKDDLARIRTHSNTEWNQRVATCVDVFTRWPRLNRFLKLQTGPSNPQIETPNDLAAELIDMEAPFLRYVLANLLIHADKVPAIYFMANSSEIKNFESILDSWRLGHKILSKFDHDGGHPNSGTTLLHIAAAANVTFLANYCLEKGTRMEIDSVDAGGNTPLHLAVSGRHVEMVEFLLGAKPNLLVRNKGNLTPLAMAFRVSCVPAASSIINYCSGRASYKSELQRMLGVAALTGSEPLTRLLIRAGVDVNARGVNALFKAAKYGHARVVYLLLEVGADVNARADLNGGALQIACSKGQTEVVEILLERRADIHEDEIQAGLARARFEDRKDILSILGQFGIG